MLAQNFLSAATLGLSADEHAALVTVLGMLERDEIAFFPAPLSKDVYIGDPGKPPVGFNMYALLGETSCGTAGCICGWAESVGHLPHGSLMTKRCDVDALDELFDPSAYGLVSGRMQKITPAQAAVALRNYLTHGEPRWSEVLPDYGSRES